jgi:hypothetical protein
MLAAASFLVFWNIRAYSWLFLGYPLYLAISLGALMLTTVGLARFAVFFAEKKRTWVNWLARRTENTEKVTQVCI